MYLYLIQTTPGKAPYFHLNYFSFVLAAFSISFPSDSSSGVQLDYKHVLGVFILGVKIA